MRSVRVDEATPFRLEPGAGSSSAGHARRPPAPPAHSVGQEYQRDQQPEGMVMRHSADRDRRDENGYERREAPAQRSQPRSLSSFIRAFPWQVCDQLIELTEGLGLVA